MGTVPRLKNHERRREVTRVRWGKKKKKEITTREEEGSTINLLKPLPTGERGGGGLGEKRRTGPMTIHVNETAQVDGPNHQSPNYLKEEGALGGRDPGRKSSLIRDQL